YQKDDFEPQKTMQLLDDLKKQMPSHSFINPVVDDVIEFIEPDQVNAVINQSRVGLCLSSAEGAMLASMEYLLAGIPVVSTDALGGRDVFADPAYWVTVDDRADAVADGVAEMAKRTLDPHQVRGAVLEKIYAHRDRLRRTLIDMTDGAVRLPDDLGDPAYREPMKWVHGDVLADATLRLLRNSDPS
ncbi:MAG: glycosyltransferase, partial [Pseudomonadota bacterium]